MSQKLRAIHRYVLHPGFLRVVRTDGYSICRATRTKKQSRFYYRHRRGFTVRLRRAKAESLFDYLKNRKKEREEGKEIAKKRSRSGGGYGRIAPAVFINQESPLCIRQHHRDIDCLRLYGVYTAAYFT